MLKDWTEWDTLSIPDIQDPKRWETLAQARDQAGDKFLIGSGISLYERVHFLRGLEDTWVDIHTAPAELGRLIDVLVDMNLYAIRGFLIPVEIEHLVFSARLITFTIGLRFLTDHLSGDLYFKIHRENHNLDRCRTQFKMVRDIEEKTDLMKAIIEKYR